MTTAPVAVEVSRVLSPAGAIRLLIGGRTTHIDGFLNVDLFEGEGVDIRADASNLSMFKDGEVSEIYCSHILEHFPHVKTLSVLKEWRRVLKRGSKAYIAVPDFDVMIKHYLSIGLTDWIANMLYGDQIYDLAFHYAPFTFARLATLVTKAGFSDVKRIKDMPYGINDCSHLVDTISGHSVSLNIEAVA
jgi:SAM-dependent methyltransferase